MRIASICFTNEAAKICLAANATDSFNIFKMYLINISFAKKTNFMVANGIRNWLMFLRWYKSEFYSYKNLLLVLNTTDFNSTNQMH